MAEVKPARDIFKKPRAEPDSSTQKPSLPIFFFSHSCHTQVMPEFLLGAHGKCSSCTLKKKKNAWNKEVRKKRADCTGQFLFILHWGLQGCRDAQAELGWRGDIHQLHLLDFPCKTFPPLCHSGPPALPLPSVPLGPSRLSEA